MTPPTRSAHPGRVAPGLARRRQNRPAETRDDRLTPFLVLRLDPTDTGSRPVMQAVAAGMPTLILAEQGGPGNDAGFRIRPGHTYGVSGEVANLGRSPALMGLARLHIVDGTTLAQHWQKTVPVFDIIDFQAWPGKAAALRFRRVWTVPNPQMLARRISIFIHVSDLSGDTAPFKLGNTGDDRHIARRDFLID